MCRASQKHCLAGLSSGDSSPSVVTSLVFQRAVDCIVVSSAWEMPKKSGIRFWLPPAFEAFCTAFAEFDASNAGRGLAARKLTWLYNEGSAVVSASIGVTATSRWNGDLLVSPLQVGCFVLCQWSWLECPPPV